MLIGAPTSTPKSTTIKVKVQQQPCLSSWNLVFPILAFVDKNSFLFLRHLDGQWFPFSNSGLGHEKQTLVNCLAWRPASGATIALGTDKGILIWRFSVSNGNIQFAKHLPCAMVLSTNDDNNISTLTWSPDGRWLLAGLKNLSGLILWDVSVGQYEFLGPLKTFEAIPVFQKTTLKCVWSDDGDYVLQILVDGGLRIWETESWTSLYYTTSSPIKDAVFMKDSKTVLLIMNGWLRFFSIASEPTAIELLNVPCSVKIKENVIGCRLQDSNLLIIYTEGLEYASISLEPLPKVTVIRIISEKDEKWVDVGFVNTLRDTIYYQLSDDYYAYDLPAALNIPLQEFLHTSTNEWNYHLNLFYALYSFPNIVLPFISGILMDRFGIHIFLFGLSCAVVLGQLLFSIGVSLKTYWIMHFGRFIFGIGGESLSVAQSRITTRWFEGKELALALSLNLAIGRLGSVLNDILSPYLAYEIGMNAAIWFGTITCILSFGCCQTLVVLDKEFIKKNKSEEELEFTLTSTDAVKHDVEISNGGYLPQSFWIICTVTCLYYAADIPFNAIHSSFLQTKWYKGNPQTASQIMAIPDTLSAVFVPAVGVFVDKFGHRCKISILCGVMMAVIHLYFAFATASSASPIPFLIGLGFSYAMLLIFWPCIPLVVPENKLSTAFGFQASALNGSLAIVPIFVAILLNADPTYTLVELFFSFCCILGILLSIYLYWLDNNQGGVLEKPQKLSISPTYTKLDEEPIEMAKID